MKTYKIGQTLYYVYAPYLTGIPLLPKYIVKKIKIEKIIYEICENDKITKLCFLSGNITYTITHGKNKSLFENKKDAIEYAKKSENSMLKKQIQCCKKTIRYNQARLAKLVKLARMIK